MTEDLRRPDPDEKALSPLEVLSGLREGSIAPGPRASRVVDVIVTEIRRVQVLDFYPTRTPA